MLMIGRINIMKMAVLSQTIFIDSMLSPSTYHSFFTELEKNYFKFHMEPKKGL